MVQVLLQLGFQFFLLLELGLLLVLLFLLEVILILNPLVHEVELFLQLLFFEEFLVFLMGIWYGDSVHLKTRPLGRWSENLPSWAAHCGT